MEAINIPYSIQNQVATETQWAYGIVPDVSNLTPLVGKETPQNEDLT